MALLGEFGRGALSARQLVRAWPERYEDELLDDVVNELLEPDLDRHEISDAHFAAVAISALLEGWDEDTSYDALYGPAGDAGMP